MLLKFPAPSKKKRVLVVVIEDGYSRVLMRNSKGWETLGNFELSIGHIGNKIRTLLLVRREEAS